VDVLLLLALAPAVLYLPSRCLAMGLYITIFDFDFVRCPSILRHAFFKFVLFHSSDAEQTCPLGTAAVKHEPLWFSAPVHAEMEMEPVYEISGCSKF
jgi:hypothetical protein